MTIRIAVGMGTGGTGKTTSTGNIALLAAERYGRDRVLAVDTDQQGQLLAWERAAEPGGATWPRTLSWLNSKLSEELERRQQKADLAVVVIDTSNNHFRLITDAFASADVVVVPLQPTGMDLDRVAATMESIEFAQAKRPNLRWGVLLSRYDSRSRDAEHARRALTDAGLPVFRTQVPSLKRIGHSFGSNVCADPETYGALFDEILEGGWA